MTVSRPFSASASGHAPVAPAPDAFDALRSLLVLLVLLLIVDSAAMGVT